MCPKLCNFSVAFLNVVVLTRLEIRGDRLSTRRRHDCLLLDHIIILQLNNMWPRRGVMV